MSGVEIKPTIVDEFALDLPSSEGNLSTPAATFVSGFLGRGSGTLEERVGRLEEAGVGVRTGKRSVSFEIVLPVAHAVAQKAPEPAIRQAATDLFVTAWLCYPGVTENNAIATLKGLDGRAKLKPGELDLLPDRNVSIMARVAAALTQGRWTDMPSVRGHALGLAQTLIARAPVEMIPVLGETVLAGLSAPEPAVYLQAQSALRELIEKGGEPVLEKAVAHLYKGLDSANPFERRASQLIVGACIDAGEKQFEMLFPLLERGLGDESETVVSCARDALSLILVDSERARTQVEDRIAKHASSADVAHRRATQQMLGARVDAVAGGRASEAFSAALLRGLGDGTPDISTCARRTLASILPRSPQAQDAFQRLVIANPIPNDATSQRAVQQILGAWVDAGLPGTWPLYSIANAGVTSRFSDVADLALENAPRLKPPSKGAAGPS